MDGRAQLAYRARGLDRVELSRRADVRMCRALRATPFPGLGAARRAVVCYLVVYSVPWLGTPTTSICDL